MVRRREFVRSFFSATAAGVALPSLRNDGLERIASAVSGVGHRSAESLAGDEEFWVHIQNAFTVDRSIINLNNGGVCPSPRVVQDAMQRYLDIQNLAPAYSMWTLLEP